MSNDHLTIGKVSALTSISEKRLRYYDQQGLCSPAYRDPATGYRYYTAEQIPRLMWISYMRSLDLPVSIIAEFFSADDLLSLKKALDVQVAKNQEAFSTAQYRYEQISEFRQRFSIGLSHIRSRDQPRFVSLVHTEPFPVLCLDCDVDSGEMTDAYRLRMFNLLDEQTRKYKFVSVGGHDIIYRNSPLLGASPARPGKTTFDIQIKNPPSVPMEFVRYNKGFLAATAVHVGPYETLPDTYRLITTWAAENGHRLNTDALEDYQITSQMVNDPELYVTQIYVPLAGHSL